MDSRTFRPLLAFAGLCLLASSAYAGGNTTTNGPDVTVFDIPEIANHGSDGELRGFSVGTDSCNVGNTAVNWCDESFGCGSLTEEQHPVIAGNLYRVKDGKLEQLGKSWLKHGFLSLNTPNPECGSNSNPDNPPSCSGAPLGGDQLGVGCTDLYGSFLNGSRALGMRYEVNPATGFFPFPETIRPFSGQVEQRISVHEDDLEPTLNAGARYFFESQYIADDDAVAETDGLSNAFNNASYREATVNGSLNMNFITNTVRERSAIYAWQAVDPEVQIANVDFVGNDGVLERFEVARKITQNGLTYRTVLAVRNMNSDHSARSLSIRLPGASFSNGFFHDVDNHSGELASGEGNSPLKTDDWTQTIASDTIRWATSDFATDPAANALRWGTAFTFAVDTDIYPGDARITIEPYKAGGPSSLSVNFVDPSVFQSTFESGFTDDWSSTSP